MKVQVLDHGYLEYIESWGSDERIVEAARMSTGKGFLGWGRICKCGGTRFTIHTPGNFVSLDSESYLNCVEKYGETPKCVDCNGTETIAGDEKLLKYLYSNHHDTPFEMAGMVIEVQAPIFVFREWHRHRTQSYNEMSARYTPLPDVNYIPSVERLLINSKTNKQAGVIKGAEELSDANARAFRDELKAVYERDESIYQWALKAGVPKELARVHLPVGRYSRMRASANLRNWLAFLTLRTAPEAQWEIRQYADEVASRIAETFPRTYALFCSGR